MVRLWCRAYAAEIDFAVDYQPWVVANFSGILCVDEVYQGDLALLLAVDPAAPDGDRLVGYTLLPKTKEVDQGMVRTFIDRLRRAGVQPDEVITDDSRLYPAVLKELWHAASHQLCLFHATRRVVRAVSDVVKKVRRALPTPPPVSKPTFLGRLRETPPAADQHDPDAERYRWRLARRTLGIAQVHELRKHIASARAIGRQLGVNHGTVRQWLKLTAPDPATVAELSGTPDLLPKLDPPPLPWHDWDEVRRTREDLWLYRTLFLHRAENLTVEEQQKLAGWLAGPVGGELRVACTFLEHWFAIWADDLGNRRSPQEAERQYEIWRTDAEAAQLTPLRRQQLLVRTIHCPARAQFESQFQFQFERDAGSAWSMFLTGATKVLPTVHPIHVVRALGSHDAGSRCKLWDRENRINSTTFPRIAIGIALLNELPPRHFPAA
jgi:hypothetical protein